MLSILETAAIACVVIGLVSRMTLLAEDAGKVKAGPGGRLRGPTNASWPAAPRVDDVAADRGRV